MIAKQPTYFFLGIGGIGMSALARYFTVKGLKVGGYDARPSEMSSALEFMGVPITYEDSLEALPKAFAYMAQPTASQIENSCVVYTPAVPETSILFAHLKASGFKMIKRAALLGRITADTFSYAVGGTHGKTTTSAMLAHLLDASGLEITAFLGGIAHNFNSNLVLKGTGVSVVEADEFDRSFLTLSPNVACITGTDADHLDIYKSKEALENAFVDFSNKLKFGGTLLVHESVSIPGITYGLLESSDYYLSHIQYKAGKTLAHIHCPSETFKEVVFPMPGTHNMLNALVAFAMAHSQGVAAQGLIAALQTFKGVKRRFSYEINTPSRIYIDDYAHHPTAINAVFDSLQQLYPNEKITLVFQPHLYSRTQDFATEFAQSLSRFYRVYLLAIYPARELPIAGVNSQWLLDQITSPKKELIGREQLLEKIQDLDTKILVTLGAGDIGLEVQKIKSFLS